MLNVTHAAAALGGNTRDKRWLMIEICREFQRGKCSREDDECRFAHPPSHVVIENGHVTACFDSLKDQCTRDSCKYLHPPKLVKEELQASSRAFSQAQTALQQLCNPLMIQQQQLAHCQSQNMISPWGFMVPQVMPLSFAPTAVMISDVPASGGRRKDKSDKLEVCREYQRSQCPRGNDECKYAHPEAHIHPDPNDNMVTVCMDFMKERCERETCRYFHPPPHLQAKVKANQLNASSLMAAAAQSHALALGGTSSGGPPSAAAAAPPPPPAVSTSTTHLLPTSYAGAVAGYYPAAPTHHHHTAGMLHPNPALALGPASMAGLGAAGQFHQSQLAGMMHHGAAGMYDPATAAAMAAAAHGVSAGSLAAALPKDPLARSTVLAQMAAEKAVLTNRKRKLMDTMSGYPDIVKRQALAGVAGPASAAALMNPWNMSQQLALQGALAGGVPQHQLINNSLAASALVQQQLNYLTTSSYDNSYNSATALMQQQAALNYSTSYASLPISSSAASYAAIQAAATPYNTAPQQPSTSPTPTPTQ